MPRTTLPRRGRVRHRNVRKHRSSDSPENEIPQVYREMLAEADARAAAAEPRQERPIKRRRVGERNNTHEGLRAQPNLSDEDVESKLPINNLIDLTQTQTVYDLDTDDASDDNESDMEWEEVVVQQPGNFSSIVQDRGHQSLDITLEKHPDVQRTLVRRRKPVTGAEKKLRLDVHKTHVLCLLGHVYTRNKWCNDDEVQKNLKQMLPKQTRLLLNPKESMPQFTRSTTFIDGLKQAMEIFARNFKITAPGLRRPYWAEDRKQCNDRAAAIMRDGEIISSRDEFRHQAKKLEGSRDFGAQLFCSLLRSVAVEARLVCSLQVLPFSGVAKGTSPETPKRDYIVISSDDNASSSDDKVVGPRSSSSANRRRLGQPSFKNSVRPALGYLQTTRSFANSPYPVFWTEVFNEAVQKWIPVDPLVTKSVARPSKFEPPASDRYNNMSYAIAFEDDLSARDVTRRYAKSYNAKLRKTRVESTKDGEAWWASVMGFYEKPFMEDRDQLEFSEFTAKSAAEPMPRNIQDFKDHPVYALERHIRHNEVIHPKRKIGQVEVAKAGSKKGSVVESVYRRADVHLVRSADGWYRLGRDIKIGEQPLKRISASQKRGGSDEETDEAFGSERTLYAIHQTELYKSPPVVAGKIPKNAFGNLDIYVPTMIPKGGFHLRHPEAARAARILGIDYAAAVTGFDFKGRHGTVVFNGIIAALQHRDALEVVIQCIEDERIQEKLERRTTEALRLWKHFLLKLRIAEKVKSYAVEGESPDVSEHEEYDNDIASNDGGFIDEGGGFMLDDNEGDNNCAKSLPNSNFETNVESSGGGFLVDEDTSSDQVDVPEDKPVEESTTFLPTHASVHSNSATLNTKRKVPRYKLIVVPKTARTEMATSLDTDEISTGEKRVNLGGRSATNDGMQNKEKPEPATKDANNSRGHMNAPISVDSSSEDPKEQSPVERLPESVESESDSALEKESLLSHDPEDEDAEPEWLMSE